MSFLLMGRQRKQRFLPKVTSTATFLSPPPSPIRVNSLKVCSSPIVSLVPKEVRWRGKGRNFESKEPTSPKVSCMGQVTCKNKLKKKKRPEEQEHHGNTMLFPFHRAVIKIFKARLQGERRGQDIPPGVQRVLSLGHAKQFSCGRGVLQNFDWKAHDIGDGSCHDGPNHCADGRTRKEHQVEEEAIELEPRKDVNLWKRRNMSPPKPLKL